MLSWDVLQPPASPGGEVPKEFACRFCPLAEPAAATATRAAGRKSAANSSIVTRSTRRLRPHFFSPWLRQGVGCHSGRVTSRVRLPPGGARGCSERGTTFILPASNRKARNLSAKSTPQTPPTPRRPAAYAGCRKLGDGRSHPGRASFKSVINSPRSSTPAISPSAEPAICCNSAGKCSTLISPPCCTSYT